MNLWDRFKVLFGADPAEFVPVKVNTKAGTTLEPTTLPYLISPDMLNTISFSTDLTTFYFIDQEKLVTFPLKSRKGVSIGLVNDQLAVVTPHITISGEVIPEETLASTDSSTIEALTKANSKERKLVLAIKENNQYTLTYHRATRSLAIIGATDIISTRNEQLKASKVGCEVYLFDLSDGPVNLIRKGDNLIFTAKEK